MRIGPFDEFDFCGSSSQCDVFQSGDFVESLGIAIELDAYGVSSFCQDVGDTAFNHNRSLVDQHQRVAQLFRLVHDVRPRT